MADENQQNPDKDISRQQLGAIYADALLGAADNAGNAQEIVDELTELVDEIVDKVDGFGELLATPRLSPEEKSGILNRVFEGRMSEDLLTFLQVVGRHGRLDCLRHISTAVRQRFNQRHGRIEVLITTSDEIDQELSNRIADSLKEARGQDIVLHCSVDADIIGGLVIRVGDKVYDGSVANQLARLREETIQKTVQQLRDAVDRFAQSG